MTVRGFLRGRGARHAEVGSGSVAGSGQRRSAGALGAFRGADQCRDGVAPDFSGVGVVGNGLQGVKVVAGDDVGDFLAVAGEGGAQVLCRSQVPGLAVAPRQRVVGDLAQHVLSEAVAAALGRQRLGVYGEHLAANQFSQLGPHRRLVPPGHRDQRLGRESGTQHRGVSDQPPHLRGQAIEPGGQQRVQAVRHGQLADVADQAVDALKGLDDVPVDQRADRFHREQRDALGLARDLRPRHGRHAGHQRVHQLVHRRRIQRVQGQRAAVPPGAEPGAGLAEFGPGEHQHIDGQVPGPVDEMVQEIQQAAVGMLGVLDQQRHRSLGGEPLEEQPPPREQLLPGQRPPAAPVNAIPSSRPSRAPM